VVAYTVSCYRMFDCRLTRKQYNMNHRNDTYQQLAAIARKHYGDSNCCTVIATAKVCKVSYGKAFNAVKRAGRLTGHGTTSNVYLQAVRTLGHTAQVVDLGLKGKTIGTAERVLPCKGSYLIHVRGHVAAWTDGVLHDWTSAKEAGKPRRHKIISIHEVTHI
jgi:hypothetical protein